MPPLTFHAQVEAGENRLPVHEHGARAALSELAAVLGPRQPQVFAQDLEQRLVRRKSGLDLFAVEAKGDDRSRPSFDGFSSSSAHVGFNLIPLF